MKVTRSCRRITTIWKINFSQLWVHYSHFYRLMFNSSDMQLFNTVIVNIYRKIEMFTDWLIQRMPSQCHLPDEFDVGWLICVLYSVFPEDWNRAGSIDLLAVLQSLAYLMQPTKLYIFVVICLKWLTWNYGALFIMCPFFGVLWLETDQNWLSSTYVQFCFAH